MRSGIYTFTAPSGGQYVGSSTDIVRRIRVHRLDLRNGRHPNSTLQRAFDKYGDSLVSRPLLYCRRADLLFFEQRAIDVLRPQYNQSKIAGRIEFTPEVRAKMRAAQLGKKMPIDLIEKQRERLLGNTYNAGKKASPETRAKMVAAHTGRTQTLQARQKVSAAQLGRIKGPASAETKSKMREAHLKIWAERRAAKERTDGLRSNDERPGRTIEDGDRANVNAVRR